LVFVLVQPASAEDIDIVDVYSDIDSVDITLHSGGHYMDITIDADLILKGEVLASRQFNIKEISPQTDITKVGFWDIAKADEGFYRTKMVLSIGGSVLETRYNNFSYGRQALPRIFIKDVVPDPKGVSIILAPHTTLYGTEPVLADVEYMLVDGDTVIYRTTERRVTVAQATPLSVNWNVLLENNHQYRTRVKVRISAPLDFVIATTEEFTATDDARITELYRDETGASVTVLGQSQVPFTGSIVFTVTENGEIIEEISEKSPILMSGDDETIEVIWSSRLAAGIYELTVKVAGNDGDVLDIWDTIIEVEQDIFADETPASTPAEESPALSIYSTAFLFILIYLSGWANRKHK